MILPKEMKKSLSTPNFSPHILNPLKKSVSTHAFNADTILTTMQNMSMAGSSVDDTVCLITKGIANNTFNSVDFPNEVINECLHPPDPANIVEKQVRQIPNKYIDIFIKRRKRLSREQN